MGIHKIERSGPLIAHDADPRRKVFVFSSDYRAIHFSVGYFILHAEEAIRHRGCFTVALSGGFTPKPFYSALAASDRIQDLPWEKIMLFWSDERAVPLRHPESNYGMAMRFFSRPPFNKAKCFPMHQAESTSQEEMAKAAKAYDRIIREQCPDGRLDLVYLGIGEDGHTASLFPHTEALKASGRLAVENYVEAKSTVRLTLTADCINSARAIVVFVFGMAKAKVLEKVLFGKEAPDDIPAQRIGTVDTPALFICDRAAASCLALPREH